jgi:AraC-like DNA-binding protein
MTSQVRFDPELVDWWQLLRRIAGELRRVHVWHPAAHPPGQEVADLHQHGTVTLVLGLAGVVRLEDQRDSLDLRPGDALLVHPGAWHRHVPVRPGSLSFGQGFIAGRSDYLFASAGRRLMAAVPPEPSRGQMDAALAAADEPARRRSLAALLATVVAEASEPLATPDPALLRMEYALWENLHRPGGAELLVQASGTGRARAFRLCQQHWGAGPATVLRRERLRLARSLLAVGLPVAEVAWRCGFASRQVFTRAFHQEHGQAPRAAKGPAA